MKRFEIIEIIEYCPMERTSTHFSNCKCCDYFVTSYTGQVLCNYDEIDNADQFNDES